MGESIDMRENEKVYSDGDIENKIIEALNEGKSDRSICNMGGAAFHNFTDAISLVTLNDWVNRGRIRAHKIGGRVLFRDSDVEAALHRIVPIKSR